MNAEQQRLQQPNWKTNGERIIKIQKRMQNCSPAFLSTTIFQDKEYVVQELQPQKNSINFNLLKDRYRDMCRVILDMAILTASTQLRSSGMNHSANADKLIRFGHNKDWHQPMLEYAEKASSKTMEYFQEFRNISMK